MKRFSTYRDAGVDIDASDDFIRRIKPLVRSTFRPGVHTEIGGFSALFSVPVLNMKKPMLVSSTDGVGTKLKVAFMMDRHDTVGIDLVGMSVNDIVICGAEPLFFLDYFATGKLKPDTAVEVIKGITQGCNEAGCSLVGGETAEMPDFYADGEYDLAGFVVGAVEEDKIIDGSQVSLGDKAIGVASTGLHSNGFSLVRKIFFNQLGLSVHDKMPGTDDNLGETLLTPTRIYVKTVLNLIRDFPISGMAHITGGGLTDNIPRILPDSCRLRIDKESWPVPKVFQVLQEAGGISETEMFRTFNMGIGLVILCPESECDNVMIRLRGLNEKAFVIGEIEPKHDPKAPSIIYR